MAESTIAPDVKADTEPETKPSPPAHLRDELLLKLVGMATIILGIVLLVSSSIAIAALSVLRFDLGPWLPILPLSLLVILIGGIVNVYFRKVIDRAMNPKKAEEAPRAPMGYAFPYQASPAYYPMRAPPPGYAPAGVPGPQTPRMPPPSATTRFCIMCGKRIPAEAKFCPYCRHAYTA